MEAAAVPRTEALDPADRAALVAHYTLVAPSLVSAFGAIPITTLFAPHGFEGEIVRVGRLGPSFPTHVAACDVHTVSGTYRYQTLTHDGLLWRVHAYAVGFESWTPSVADGSIVHFGHVNLIRHGLATIALQRRAARLLRERLDALSLDAFLTLDGPGLMLWLPLGGACDYPSFRSAFHALARELAVAHPDVFEKSPNGPPDRIRISAASNAPGHGAALPYTARVQPGLPLNLPIAWSELDSIDADDIDVASFPKRFATGDVLAAEIARIGSQSLAALAPKMLVSTEENVFEIPEPRSEVLTVAIALLGDGKPRTVDELLALAVARDLWPKTERRKYVYATLKAYVEKCIARGQKPLIVEDADRRFHLNRPADDLPDPKPRATWTPPADLIARLKATADGTDPTAFEVAVCDAFVALGFLATHVGGTMNPDGYLDAPLGPRAYRVMLECKSGAAPLTRPDVFEAAKFKSTYAATYCVMIASAYGGDTETPSEAQNHGVALWTLDDLLTVLDLGANPHELEAAFAPGLAADSIGDLAWSRDHGARKRLAVIADAIVETALQAQRDAAAGNPNDAPYYTRDAAMLLVDAWLRRKGSASQVTRFEIDAVFAYLANPFVARAVFADDARTALIVVDTNC